MLDRSTTPTCAVTVSVRWSGVMLRARNRRQAIAGDFTLKAQPVLSSIPEPCRELHTGI